MCDVCGKGVLPERHGREVKERAQHGLGMGEETSGSEVLRKYEGALGSRSGSKSACESLRLVSAEDKCKTVAGTRRWARGIYYFE
jgi:hypothetical protein